MCLSVNKDERGESLVSVFAVSDGQAVTEIVDQSRERKACNRTISFRGTGDEFFGARLG